MMWVIESGARSSSESERDIRAKARERDSSGARERIFERKLEREDIGESPPVSNHPNPLERADIGKFCYSPPGSNPPLPLPFLQAADPHIHSDAVFGVKSSLIATYARVSSEDPDAKKVGFKGGEWLLEWDFVLGRE